MTILVDKNETFRKRETKARKRMLALVEAL